MKKLLTVLALLGMVGNAFAAHENKHKPADKHHKKEVEHKEEKKVEHKPGETKETHKKEDKVVPAK